MNKFRERKNKETHKAFEKKNEVVDLQKFNNEDSDARFTFSKRRRLKKSKFKKDNKQPGLLSMTVALP